MSYEYDPEIENIERQGRRLGTRDEELEQIDVLKLAGVTKTKKKPPKQLKDPVEHMIEKVLIAEEISQNFQIAERILREVDKRHHKDAEKRCGGFSRSEILLAYICAKQTKHHLIEETLLKREKK